MLGNCTATAPGVLATATATGLALLGSSGAGEGGTDPGQLPVRYGLACPLLGPVRLGHVRRAYHLAGPSAAAHGSLLLDLVLCVGGPLVSRIFPALQVGLPVAKALGGAAAVGVRDIGKEPVRPRGPGIAAGRHSSTGGHESHLSGAVGPGVHAMKLAPSPAEKGAPALVLPQDHAAASDDVTGVCVPLLLGHTAVHDKSTVPLTLANAIDLCSLERGVPGRAILPPVLVHGPSRVDLPTGCPRAADRQLEALLRTVPMPFLIRPLRGIAREPLLPPAQAIVEALAFPDRERPLIPALREVPGRESDARCVLLYDLQRRCCLVHAVEL
mmetsp:Transcript_22709/g.40820  ORF Transcript_22709/g.40820 Transcript_22709/m.40820 type:complete len:328 (+) Transcript_22709:367-1350(+)